MKQRKMGMRIEAKAVSSHDSGSASQIAALQRQLLSAQKQLGELTKQLAATTDRDAKQLIRQQIQALQQQIEMIQEQMKRLAMPVEKDGSNVLPALTGLGKGSLLAGSRVNTRA